MKHLGRARATAPRAPSIGALLANIALVLHPLMRTRLWALVCFAHAAAAWALLIALVLQGRGPQALLRSSLTATSSISSGRCEGEESVHFSQRVVTPSGVAPALLHVRAGTLQAVERAKSQGARAFAAKAGVALRDHGDRCISPGLIDAHVHVSALGGRGWEGYASATRAAAAGGVTAIIGMPLNSLPPTTNLAALQLELEQAKTERPFVDVGFWGGVVPSSLGELDALLSDVRVLGIKAFLSPLPPAAGYDSVSTDQLADAAAILTAHDSAGGGSSRPARSLPLLVHCELFGVDEAEALQAAARGKNRSRAFATFAATRPERYETDAINALLRIVDAQPALRAHVVHLSTATALPSLAAAKSRAAGRLTVETCPHYLFFEAERVPDGETRLKCLPPLRDAANREGLWSAVADGTLDLIASDHSPCLPEMRGLGSGDFLSAWAGISGLQFNLPATWTEASRRGFGPADLARWWSEGPAKLSGQWHAKGSLEAGKDADFVVWEPEADALTDRTYHRHAGSPWTARTDLKGKVVKTFLRGVEVFTSDDALGGRVQEARRCGRVLERHEKEMHL